MRGLLGAVSFLTVLPVSAPAAPAGRTAAYFPLVGACLGASGALLFLLLEPILPLPLAALFTVLLWIVTARILREDSRWTLWPLVGVTLTVLVQWQALQRIPSRNIWLACIAAQTLPRVAIVALSWASRPADHGIGADFAATLRSSSVIAALLQGLAVLLVFGWRPGLVIFLGTYLALRVTQIHTYSRSGGMDADGLGVTELLLETLILAFIAWLGYRGAPLT